MKYLKFLLIISLLCVAVSSDAVVSLDGKQLSPQNIDSSMDLKVSAPKVNVYIETEKIAPKEIKVYLPTVKDVAVEVKKEIDNLSIHPDIIFNPDFSEITNLKINPVVEKEKVIYKLELPTDTAIYKEKNIIQPIFDLRIDKPVEFRIKSQQIEIGNEQIIDYKKVISKIEGEKAFSGINIEVQSMARKEMHNIEVVPKVNSAVFKFTHREQTVSMPVYSDFKVENKKLYLIENKKIHNLKVLPTEIYSSVHSIAEKNPKVIINLIDLKVENDKPVYDLRVEEPFKLLWLIPMKIQTKYLINPADGSVNEKEKPWYSFLGSSIKLFENLSF
ncbi:hypothetical protein KAS79_00695 [Candidatus Parcubacteria bacterium]|nr:hypothetical protein [Candidatus Parcubacteria bacterium]